MLSENLLKALPLYTVNVALVLRPSPPKCMQTCTDPSPSSTVKEVCSRVGAIQIDKEHLFEHTLKLIVYLCLSLHVLFSIII